VVDTYHELRKWVCSISVMTVGTLSGRCVIAAVNVLSGSVWNMVDMLQTWKLVVSIGAGEKRECWCSRGEGSETWKLVSLSSVRRVQA
jgi:hypothetical protein